MIYILTACMIMLVIAAILVTIRTVRGPTSLDRMVSVDMVSSILIGAVALLAALTKRSDLVALFIVLALIGFVGSMTLARFITPLDPEAQRNVGWRAERELEKQMSGRTDEHAPVHDMDVYDPDDVDFSGTNVDSDDVMETGPQHDGATPAERREP